MLMPILQKKENILQHKAKLKEEVIELIKEINKADKEGFVNIDHLLEETFDTIQVLIGILDFLRKEHNVDLTKASIVHTQKLLDREWKFDEILSIRKI